MRCSRSVSAGTEPSGIRAAARRLRTVARGAVETRLRVAGRDTAAGSGSGFGLQVAHSPSTNPWIHSSLTQNPSEYACPDSVETTRRYSRLRAAKFAGRPILVMPG